MSREVIPERSDHLHTDHQRTDQIVSTSPMSQDTVTADRMPPPTLSAVPAGSAMPGPFVPAAGEVPVAAVPHVVRRTTVRRRVEADAVLAGAAGIVLLVVGLLALVRAGTDGSWDTPVVEVAGFTHTALLGVIEIGAGVALLLAGVSRSRSASALWGVALGIAGFIGGVQAESFRDSLALESSMGWWALGIGAVVALAALALPRRTHTASVVDTE